MALTPLHDAAVAPPPDSTVELRYFFGGGATAWSAPPFSAPLDFPYTPTSDIWLTDGLYLWRYMTATEAFPWRAFRAKAGYGVEGVFDGPLMTAASMDDPIPANGSPAILDTLTLPSFGAENVCGLIVCSADFSFNHMWDLNLSLINPIGDLYTLWLGPNSLSSSASDYAFEANVAFVSFAQGGEDNYGVPMVDGHAYSTGLNVRGRQASGDWSLLWEGSDASLAFPDDHFGVLRSWRIEFIPE